MRLLKTKQNQSFLATVLVLLFLVPSFLPIVGANDSNESSTSARTDKLDFKFTNPLQLDNAGSSMIGTNLYLEPGEHTITVEVSSTGSASSEGEYWLILQHKGAANLGFTEVDSSYMGMKYGNGNQIDYSPTSFTWLATSGAGQELRVEIGSHEPSSTKADNIQSLGPAFSVERKHKGEVIDAPTFPEMNSTQNMTLAKASHDLTATVTNTGVVTLSAQLTILLTNTSDPSITHTDVSGIKQIEPGSYPDSPQTVQGSASLTATLDAAALGGVWEFHAYVTFYGTSWSEEVTVKDALGVDYLGLVNFSNFNSEITPPSQTYAQPGQSAVMTFILKNSGNNSDTFEVSFNESEWATPWVTGIDPVNDNVPPYPNLGSIVLVRVYLDIPDTAPRGTANKITLTFKSGVGSSELPPTNYVRTSEGLIIVSDFYDGTIAISDKVAGGKIITPGASVNFTASIQNTGSVPTSFALSTGLSNNAINWTTSLSAYTTPFIAPQAFHDVKMTVEAPRIQDPLVTAEYNTAYDQLDVWVQSRPIGGGTPVTDTAAVKVAAIIAVDPGLSTESYMMSSSELEDTISGNFFSTQPVLDLQIVNNLPIGDAFRNETITATISLSKSFTAANEGGFGEADRWSATISNSIYTGRLIADATPNFLTIGGPPPGHYPIAGTFTVGVTITTKLSDALELSGITAHSITQSYSVVVPPIIKGTFIDVNPTAIPAGTGVALPLLFVNTGNDVGSYRLRIINDLPDKWTTNFSDTDSSIDNLTFDLADGTIDSIALGGSVTHTKSVGFNVQTDPLSPAGMEQVIRIRIENPTSGQLIGENMLTQKGIDYSFEFTVIVLPSLNATLSPTNQTEELDVFEETWTTVTLRNTGNAPTDYTITLDKTLAGAVDFEIESPANSKIFIAAGFEEKIRIKMTATGDANANGFYMATVNVNADDGALFLSSNIVANISTLSNFQITSPNQIAVTPGEQEKIDFSITNNGNSLQTLNITFAIANSNLSLSHKVMTKTLDIGENQSDFIIVSIPSLGGADSLVEGASFDLTITVIPSTDPTNTTSNIVELLVQPLFIVESSDWPSEMKFRPESDRIWEVTFTNTGNQNVSVNIVYSITRPGLSNLSTDWEMRSQPTQIFLPRNTPVIHTFKAIGTVKQPLMELTADLNLFINPVNTSIEGSGVFTSKLVMSRFYTTEDIGLQPEIEPLDGPLFKSIPYTNIPESNGALVAYELELCNSQRLRDISALGQNPLNYSWNFTLHISEADGTTSEYPLDLEQECGSASIGQRFNLPLAEPWNPSSFVLEIDIPNRGSILPGDGWDLTFRLYHPDENLGYTEYSEETFKFVLAVFADPMIKDIKSSNDFEEGTESIITVTIQNVGSAKALDVIVDLQCVGLTVSAKDGESPRLFAGSVAGGMTQTMIKEFGPGEIQTLQWVVTANSIDWWSQGHLGACTATLNASYMDSNVEGNDALTFTSEVSSWSPGVQNSFISCVVCLLVSIILFRLTSQNDNFRLLGIYAGVLSLGFSFHIFSEVWWGFVVLALSALWIWRVSWGSTEEFRLLHEDYQRARKGVSTLYSDHFDELANTRRQLSVILAVPVLGMLAVVLGVPPTLTIDKINMISLVAYVAVVIIGVWVLIKRADTMYGSLYGRLTDIEVKSIRLERDLSDPARLFNELAVDGLNLDDIFNDVDPSRLQSEAIFSNEEVNDDA